MSYSNPLVIYHANCRDGFTAAWVAWQALGQECEFFPANYGQDPPDCTGRDVYILDFSYKRPVMRKILSQAMKVVVLDHHKTAREELDGLMDEFIQRPDLISNPPGSELPVIRFDMEKSGAMLAWEYFFPGRRPPNLVRYVQDRDLWEWKLNFSRQVNAYIESVPMDFSSWRWLSEQIGYTHDEGPKREVVDKGFTILDYKGQLIEGICASASEVSILGHRVLAVNTSVFFSEVAGQLSIGRPFGAAYWVRQDGVTQWSLRSEPDGLDVSEIARAHGGGGHKHAAGFQGDPRPHARIGPTLESSGN